MIEVTGRVGQPTSSAYPLWTRRAPTMREDQIMELRRILRQVAEGSLEVEEAERRIVEGRLAERGWKQRLLVRAASRPDGFRRMMPLLFTGMGAVFAVVGAVEGWRSWEFARRGIE